MSQLGQSLIEPHLRRRLTETRLPREIRSIIRKVLKIEDTVREVNQEGNTTSRKRRRCYLCPSTLDSKHRATCSSCNNYVCKAHAHSETKLLCETCQNRL